MLKDDSQQIVNCSKTATFENLWEIQLNKQIYRLMLISYIYNATVSSYLSN